MSKRAPIGMSLRSLVLVVDDDDPFREFLTVALGSLGFDVSAAVDGVEGLANLAMRTPVAIITDMTMPRLDGLEFCRRVRAMPAFDHIPIVVLTGEDLTCERMLALRQFHTVTASSKAIALRDLALLLEHEVAA